jgi:hypothetical protein
VKPVVSSWPVCGKCCEVAPFPWFGETHHFVQDHSAEPDEYGDGRVDTRPGSIAERQETFGRCLRRAIHDGERSGGTCMGIDDQTFAAINVVADEFPHASISSIAAAHEEFARDVRGIHFFESRAVGMACRAGVIPQKARPESSAAPVDAPARSGVIDAAEVERPADGDRPAPATRKKRPPREYGAHSITIIEPDPAAARAWILANRADPSELYREHVLNGDWRPSCID